MERKYSLAIHDFRISGDEITVKKLKKISDIFPGPLTLHLIFDQALKDDTALFNYLSENIKTGKIEIVFHGLTHLCSKKVARWLAFYHKYQAEYMVDSDLHRKESAQIYHQLSDKLGYRPGICPPCWIAHKKNIAFFNSLNPPYVETLLYTSVPGGKYFSAVISLASPNDIELFFLRILARVIYSLSRFLKIKRIRVAIHECDLYNPESLEFFKRMISSLEKYQFHAVLLKELI